MPDAAFVIRQGDTASNLTDTLRDSSGAAIDLTAAEVALTLRPMGGGEGLAVAATNDQIDESTTGQVSYAWQEGDTDTPGFYLGAWTVTFNGGAVQTYPNDGYFLVQITPQAPDAVNRVYVGVEELKASGEMTDLSFADGDIAIAVEAASRMFDEATGRFFWLDPDATTERIYTPEARYVLPIDDLVVLTSVKVDRTGDGVYEETWTRGTDFLLHPANSPADGKPYESIMIRRFSGRFFPPWIDDSVKVTGQFGWATVPGDVKVAVSILAARYVLRTRQAPFGIVTFYTEGAASGAGRIARTDPDVGPIVQKYSRHRPFI